MGDNSLPGAQHARQPGFTEFWRENSFRSNIIRIGSIVLGGIDFKAVDVAHQHSDMTIRAEAYGIDSLSRQPPSPSHPPLRGDWDWHLSHGKILENNSYSGSNTVSAATILLVFLKLNLWKSPVSCDDFFTRQIVSDYQVESACWNFQTIRI